MAYAFGHLRGQTVDAVKTGRFPEPYLFTQKERDEESGLHYFEARFIEPRVGRFTRVDPLEISPDSMRLTDPQMMNPYAYCANRPVNHTDPSGLEESLSEKWGKQVVIQAVETFVAYALNHYVGAGAGIAIGAYEGVHEAHEHGASAGFEKFGSATFGVAVGVIIGHASPALGFRAAPVVKTFARPVFHEAAEFYGDLGAEQQRTRIRQKTGENIWEAEQAERVNRQQQERGSATFMPATPRLDVGSASATQGTTERRLRE